MQEFLHQFYIEIAIGAGCESFQFEPKNFLVQDLGPMIHRQCFILHKKMGYYLDWKCKAWMLG